MKYFIIGSLLIIATGIGIFLLSKNNEPVSPISEVQISQDDTEKISEVSQQTNVSDKTNGGMYVDYSPEALESNKDKNIVIFFHAEWCPNCLALERTLTAGAIPIDMVILKADYDQEVELKKKYGVTQQTTLVHVNSAGDKQNLWVASANDDIEDIKSKIM